MTARVLITILLVVTSRTVANPKPIEVSIQQLIATPQQFNGKQVSVTGYFATTETHVCDLRASKKRPNDNRQLINIEIPEGSESALDQLTHHFTTVVRAHMVGTFQYRYVGPVKETPVSGDLYVQKIVTMQTGFGWGAFGQTNHEDFRFPCLRSLSPDQSLQSSAGRTLSTSF